MDFPVEFESSSSVEVNIELDESGQSIPFCAFTWGQLVEKDSAYLNSNEQKQAHLGDGELFSENDIKQEQVEYNECVSEADTITIFVDDKQTPHPCDQSDVDQTSSPKEISYNDSLTCSKPLLNTSHDTVSSGTKGPTCPFCPEMKFVSEVHLLAHNIDKHGFKVPGDLENTVESHSTPIGLSEFSPDKESTASDTNCKFKSNIAMESRSPDHFECSMCDFKCGQPYILREHWKSHTELEKPFHCTFCDFKSHWRNNLTTHIKTHTGEKPFQCTMCEYRCLYKTSLINHLRIHSGEKPFHCTKCNFKCNQKGSLRRHIKKFHTESEKIIKEEPSEFIISG